MCFIAVNTPNVSVSSVIVALGSEADLTCTVTVANDGLSLVNATVTLSPSAMIAQGPLLTGNTFTSEYGISSVSETTATEYNCSAVIAANNGNAQVLPSSAGSGVGTVYAAGMLSS